MIDKQSRRLGIAPPRTGTSSSAAPRAASAWPGTAKPAFVAPGRLDELLAEAAHAGRLAADLLAAPASERLRIVAEDARYRLPSLARLLALHAEERLDAAPEEAEEHAHLALAISLSLPRPAVVERQLRGTCAWLLGRAQLRTGKLDAAEASFNSIHRHAGSGGAGERALAAAGLAQLRWQQRRAAGTWALLAVASKIFADLEDRAAVCACRSLCGFLLLSKGETVHARFDLRTARRMLDRFQAPSLDVLLCLALVHCEVAVGGRQAPHYLALARDASRICTAAPVLGLGAWWEAVSGLGRVAGEAQVDDARRRALAAGDLGAAARATLCQAMRCIAAEQGELVAALAAPLADLGLEGEIWSEEISALAPLALRRPPAYMAAARELALRLAVEAIPVLAAECPPRGVCDLANRLLLLRPERDPPVGDLGDPS